MFDILPKFAGTCVVGTRVVGVVGGVVMIVTIQLA